MSNSPLNPTSFRLPFESELRDQPEGVQRAHRAAFQGILDLNQAIVSLKSQVDAKVVSTTDAATSAVATTGASGVTSFNARTGAITYFPALANVNNQGTATVYTTQTEDNGGLVVMAPTSAAALTLNFTVMAPWFTTISNQGSATITMTPSQGLVNGAATFPIPAGSFGTVYFDGANWWVDAPPAATTGYSLGGTVTTANVALGAGAGSGATITAVVGLDGNHQVTITTGTGPVLNGIVYTLTFTASRGHNVFPIGQCSIVTVGHAHTDLISPGGLATSYAGYAKDVALDASTSYTWNVSAP